MLADQGTAFYDMAPHLLPSRVTFVGQPLWASIGCTLPAALGAGLAAPDGRAVLFIGDGAAQMTVQELSTILHADLPVLELVVDNNGYTVERAIHRTDEPYNDIAHGDWTSAPRFFGVDAPVSEVRTVPELRHALDAARPRGPAPGLTRCTVDLATCGLRGGAPDLLALTDLVRRWSLGTFPGAPDDHGGHAPGVPGRRVSAH